MHWISTFIYEIICPYLAAAVVKSSDHCESYSGNGDCNGDGKCGGYSDGSGGYGGGSGSYGDSSGGGGGSG